MSYLLDTNVLSELRRKRANREVVAWVESRPSSALFLSVLSVGEIRRGIEALTASPRRLARLDWLETELPRFFAGRVLAVDVGVADRWGRILSAAKRSLPAIDSLLAATAMHHGLTMVTRNVRDFASVAGLEVIDPWNGSPGGLARQRAQATAMDAATAHAVPVAAPAPAPRGRRRSLRDELYGEDFRARDRKAAKTPKPGPGR